MQTKIKFGFGFDIHRLAEGRKLIMGGIEIKHNKGLLGHSDGDVVLHAICDAALGAIAAGEIGVFYPPTDVSIAGISSVVIAKRVLEVLKEKGAEITHIDATVVAEEPKMRPHYDAVRKSLNEIFAIGLENISFKAKSHEGLGEIGRGEAIACYAAVTVNLRSQN
ncbi:2-C-methyl-D-erythritol 2,4-cyclodiphosphate synthase [Candidatus Proelusimicrobium excrementi]|uniref:2-C-methyl-D-erythritol 2,4-cyclodiphosphate synthase n=1 Tax=Candidatus Proelusimicrobium excrementi TaxID=3416222 RepID=UPI003CC0AFFD|nr:2-C-methyl-D-erythritol 2,4-cyclodiphosphate synthase [Elusimicrobiaceae bacterium]